MWDVVLVRCAAYNASGSGSASTISASTAACPPPPPVAVPGSVPNMRVSAATASSVTVAWDAPSGTVGGYRLFAAVLMAPRLRCSGSSWVVVWDVVLVRCAGVQREWVGFCIDDQRLDSCLSPAAACCGAGVGAELRVSAATASSVTVAWDAPADRRRRAPVCVAVAVQWVVVWDVVLVRCAGVQREWVGFCIDDQRCECPLRFRSPTNTGLPTVRGQDTVGSKLRGSRGTWSGHPSSYLYQWLRCDSAGENCAAIAGGTAQNYVQRSVDQGLTVRLQVTATNDVGSAKAVSRQSSVIG